MKKRMLTAMLAAILVLSLGGVAQAQTPEAPSPKAPVVDSVSDDTPLADVPEFVPGEVPAEISISEAMTPAVHGMMLAMFHYNTTHFDSANPVLTWEALYNMLSLYGQMDERSEYADDCLVIPAEVVADFSTVLTDDFAALGELPDELTDRMTYDSEADSYHVVCGSDDLAEVRVDSATPDTLSGALVYVAEDEVLSSFTADLHPADNLFGFAITGLVLN